MKTYDYVDMEMEFYKDSKLKLPDRVQYLYDAVIASRVVELNYILDGLTPIEQLIYLALLYHKDKGESGADDGKYHVMVQPKLMFDKKMYKPDFVLFSVVDDREVLSIIECDGHEFHEKTKEQAKKDKQRDRIFVKNGYKVIRFSGSEIYDDPMGCVIEALTIHYGYLNKEDLYGNFKGQAAEEYSVPGFEHLYYALWYSQF